MLDVLACLVLLAPPALQDEGTPPPDPELVRETVEVVDEALKSGTTEEKVAALQRAAQVEDAAVVAAIAKGLKERETEVRAATLGVLRFMDHPDALAALTKAYRRDKSLREEPELYEALVKAIAQHGRPESVELLAEFSGRDLTYKVQRARILGLGMIRSPESLEALFGTMAKLGRGRLQPYMGDFRVALVVLTGDDHGGESQDAWQRWWNDHKKGFEVSPEPPRLPDRMRRAWTRYWDLPDVDDRPEKRRERGR